MVYLFIHTWCNNEKIKKFAANICWSSRRLQDVFSITVFPLPRRLAKTSWRHLARRLEDVWKMKKCYTKDVFKTSRRNVLKMSWWHVLKTFWRHVLKTSWTHFLKTLEDMSWRCFQDVLETKKMFTGNISV